MMIPRHDCVTVQEDTSLAAALEQLEKKQIDGVPVLQGEKYIGVATRFNIYEKYFLSGKQKDEFLISMTVKDIATHQDKYLLGEEVFERTLLDLKDFPLLAVVDANRK